MAQAEYIGDIVHDEEVREGVHKLLGAVIGEAIKPTNVYRLANGRMNRPEDRGGDTKEWLASEDGKFWLELAGLTKVINPATILAIANDPRMGGYDGQNNWD